MGTMKRMVWHTGDSWRLTEDEVPIPKPPADGALLKVLWTGICRSDLSAVKDGWFQHVKRPLVFGHEICGRIEEFGSDVDKGSSQVSVGQTVLVYGPAGCAKCGMCTGGSRFCLGIKDFPAGVFYGLGQDGGFAQYMVVHQVKDLIPILDGLPLDLTALLACGGLTAFNAVEEVRGSIEDRLNAVGKATLLVIGSGGLGLWAMQIARSFWGSGVQICVADITEEKLALAKKNGADLTVLWGNQGEAPELSQKTKEVCGGGIDACTDFVNTTLTFTAALMSYNRNGTHAMIGIHKGQNMSPMPLGLLPTHTIRLIGVTMGSKDQLKRLMQMAQEKKVKGPPISHVTLFEVNDVFEKLLNSAQEGRAVIDMEKTFAG